MPGKLFPTNIKLKPNGYKESQNLKTLQHFTMNSDCKKTGLSELWSLDVYIKTHTSL